MPRGIPKDPNHPRNKKRQDVSAPEVSAEPKKRRGRPPGKKNATSTVSSAPAVPQLKKTQTPVRVEVDIQAQIRLVQLNINILSKAAGRTASSGNSPSMQALNEQIHELSRLTDKLLNPNDESEVDETPVVQVTPPAVQSVPQQLPSVQLQTVPNNLPTPPSFVPPPFPPPGAQ